MMANRIEEKSSKQVQNKDDTTSSISSLIHVAGFAGGFLLGFRALDNLIIGIVLGVILSIITSGLWAFITGKAKDDTEKPSVNTELVHKGGHQKRTWKDVE